MKKFFLLLSLVLILANSAFAQAAKKKTTPAPASKNAPVAKAAPAPVSLAVAPKLADKEPSFAGFTGSFFKFGNMSGDSRPFSVTIEYKPWFFEVKGLANAGHNTEDLDIILEDIIGVMAYYDAQGKAADGTSYQAGLFDFMVYLDDEPIKVSNLSITLIDKAAAGSAVLAQAKTWNFEPGKVFKTPKYSNDVIKAQAGAMDKADIAKEEAAAKKRVSDSIAAEKKRVADSIAAEKKRVTDSIAKIEKRKKDSIAKEKKRVADSIAEIEALKEQAKRKAAAAKKKKAVVEEEDEDDEDYEPPKKKAPPKKKKKPVVEEDDEEDDEPPPPKKKTTKKKK